MNPLLQLLASIGALIGLAQKSADVKRGVIARGLPLARKYARSSNPAEVRTRYAGPWGTSANPNRYMHLGVTGQCMPLPPHRRSSFRNGTYATPNGVRPSFWQRWFRSASNAN